MAAVAAVAATRAIMAALVAVVFAMVAMVLAAAVDAMLAPVAAVVLPSGILISAAMRRHKKHFLVQAHQRALKAVRAAGVETAAVVVMHTVVLAAASVVASFTWQPAH